MQPFNEQVAPSANEAARAIIAAALMDQDAAERAAEVLTPGDFQEASDAGDKWAAIFTALKSLTDEGRRPNPYLVSERMKRLDLAPKTESGPVDMAGRLLELARTYAPGASVDQYVEILRRHSLRRRIFQAGLKLMNLSRDERPETAEYAGMVESIVTEAITKGPVSDIQWLPEIALRRLEEHKLRKPGEFPGLRTGFRELDVSLRGMQAGDLIILAARPSMGKSALAQEIGYNVARQGKAVLFVSREMPAEQLADRSLAQEGWLSASELRGALIPAEKLDGAGERLKVFGFTKVRFAVDTQSRTVPEVRAKAMRMKRQDGGLDLIIIDYLQRMVGTGRYSRGASRVLEIGEISGALKELARDLGIPVIALSQLSRALENRPADSRRPVLSDLRESGDIEQDADVVAFLHREHYFNRDADPREAEIVIAKNRNGPLGTVQVVFVADRVAFLDGDPRK
jgi:replicative DNA helicase